jgi:glutamate--cysteine ligase
MLEWPLAPDERRALLAQSQQSLDDQRATEAADSLPFDVYLQRYLAPERLAPAVRRA